MEVVVVVLPHIHRNSESLSQAGSGISEIKVVLGGFVIKKLLGGWTLIVKSMGLMLAVGAGMMVGKEGPCVHLGCCMANLISRLFSKYRGNEVRACSLPWVLLPLPSSYLSLPPPSLLPRLPPPSSLFPSSSMLIVRAGEEA